MRTLAIALLMTGCVRRPDLVVTPRSLNQVGGNYAVAQLAAEYRVENTSDHPVVVRKWNVTAESAGPIVPGAVTEPEPLIEVPANGTADAVVTLPMIFRPEDGTFRPPHELLVRVTAAPSTDTGSAAPVAQELMLFNRWHPTASVTRMSARFHDSTADVDWAVLVTNPNKYITLSLERAELTLSLASGALPKLQLTGPVRVPPQSSADVALTTTVDLGKLNASARDALKYQHELSYDLRGIAWFDGYPIEIDAGGIILVRAP